MEGFIRGGNAEGGVNLLDVLPESLRGFSTKAQQEAFAAAHEAKHGVVVLRPWEGAEERAARLAKQRKANAGAPPAPSFGMAPERAKRELRQITQLLQALTPDHPQYDDLRRQYGARLNEMEDVLQIPRTNFESVQAKAKTAEVSPELLDKLKKFKALGEGRRRASINQTMDVEYLRLIVDHEDLPELQDEAVTRLAELGVI